VFPSPCRHSLHSLTSAQAYSSNYLVPIHFHHGLLAFAQAPLPSGRIENQKDAPRKTESGANAQKNPNTVTIVNPIIVQGTLHEVKEPTPQEEQDRAEEKSKRRWESPDWITAIAAVAATVFAFFAFCASYSQAKSTKGMLLLTHRPRIIIRNVASSALRELCILRDRTGQKIGNVIDGSFSVVNTGNTETTIQTMRVGCWIEQQLPHERPDKDFPGFSEPFSLAPGESKEMKFAVILPVKDTLALTSGIAGAYIIALVKYADKAGIVRETSACRHLDRHDMRFKITDDPDYEYAD
jgi:hypothetical protein